MGQGIKKSSESALYIVRTEKSVGGPYGARLDIGAWSENHTTRKGAVLTSVSVGRNVGDRGGVHADLYMGVLFKTSNDTLLSSNFQFTEDAQVCYRDACLGYKHISNAGLKKPNLGRDYLTLGITFRMD